MLWMVYKLLAFLMLQYRYESIGAEICYFLLIILCFYSNAYMQYIICYSLLIVFYIDGFLLAVQFKYVLILVRLMVLKLKFSTVFRFFDL